jgi:protein TonB
VVAIISTDTQFEQPALEAVNRWKFRPAKKDGRPVVAQVMVPVRFTSSN